MLACCNIRVGDFVATATTTGGFPPQVVAPSNVQTETASSAGVSTEIVSMRLPWLIPTHRGTRDVHDGKLRNKMTNLASLGKPMVS